MVDVACGVNVELRRRRLAGQRRVRGADVERAEAHERGIRGRCPLGHDPREREDRCQREGEREGESDPPGARVEVPEPENRV